MLKVLLLPNSLEDDGPGRLVLGICRALRDEPGLRLRVAAWSRGGVLEQAYGDLGIPATVVPRGGGLRWAREEAALGVDVLHTHLLKPDIAGRLLKGRLGARVLVSTCHGLHAIDEKGPLLGAGYRLLDAMTRSRVDAWTAVSRSLAGEMREAGYRRVAAIPNGIDTSALDPSRRALAAAGLRSQLRIPAGAPVVLVAGNLRRVKGPDVALKAFLLLRRRHPDARLVFAGEGPERPALEALAARAGASDAVHFAGFVREELPMFLMGADILLATSRAESFGLAVAEALAAGTPVVASRVGGLPDLVRDGEAGVLVPPEDHRAAARAMDRLLRDEALRRRLGEAGRARVLREFTIERAARETLAFWRRAAASSLRRRASIA